jgi:glucose/arabinose dehydrogenase
MRRDAIVAPALALALMLAPGAAPAREGPDGPLALETMAEGLDEPWSVAFLPGGDFLVTERGGRLLRYGPSGGQGRRISGVPEVHDRGQGGLFDVLVPRDFDETGEVILSYATPQRGGAGTAVAAARLEGDRLTGLRLLWEMPEGTSGGRHFGGRIAEGADGAIWLTTGDRGAKDPAQDPASGAGAVIRIGRDGTPAEAQVPDGLPGLWSYGHRNPQGLAFDGEGRLWASEHGAMGGDEVNLIEPGRNYGWPVIAYGRNYNGTRIGIGTAAPGMVQPDHVWDPSIAPSGHVVYSGRLWPDWAGRHLIGSLKFDYIAVLAPDAGWAETRIEGPETGRVRDIREAPDGSIWFLSVNDGALYRMTPGTGG